MATRKGIHIFGTYVVHHKLYAFFIYICKYSKKSNGRTGPYFILLKLNDHPTRYFSFSLHKIHPDGCKFELN